MGSLGRCLCRNTSSLLGWRAKTATSNAAAFVPQLYRMCERVALVGVSGICFSQCFHLVCLPVARYYHRCDIFVSTKFAAKHNLVASSHPLPVELAKPRPHPRNSSHTELYASKQ